MNFGRARAAITPLFDLGGVAGHILLGLVLMAAVTGTAFAQTPTAVNDAYAAA